MKKVKAKTAAQKKRAKAKAKLKAAEQKRGNWVLDRLDWIKGSVDHHKTNSNNNDNDGGSDSDSDSDSGVNNNNDNCGEVDNTTTTTVDDNDNDKLKQQKDTHDISIISWNVLADSYCSRSSHKNLPSKFQSQIFNRKQRQHDVRQTLRLLDAKLMPDLIGLQEVDPPLEVSKCMKSLGYGAVETLASPDGRNGRVDSCGLYYRKSQWTCLDYETIRLDDIAILRSSSSSSDEADTTTIQNEMGNKKRSRDRSSTSISHHNSGSLKGLQRSFVRKNVALLVQLGHIPTGRRVVVVVAHLFWNPAYEYVKLCQTHYVATRAEAFCREKNINNNDSIKDVPVIWCGDFNSQPGGSVHQYLTTGVVNAKAVAPWYDTIASREQRQEKQNYNNNNNNSNTNTMDIGNTDDDCQDMTGNLDRLNLSESNNTSDAIIDDNNQKADIKFPKVKYILDYTLNRLCRWLRILGIDAAIETEEEEIERTRDAKM
jgi:mRNA deadenylase 3'-5' endonuclease subunit Ccr4